MIKVVLSRCSRLPCKFLSRRLAMTNPASNIFDVNRDKYNGVNIDTTNITLSDLDFKNTLKDSLLVWKETGVRGVWFKIPIAQAVYVPLLAAQGFEYHHAKSSYVMMTKWLVDEPNALPAFPHTHIGVAGLVVNNQNEVLVIKEKYHTKKHWKFPGGYSNPGEDFADTAKREVLEETGIQTEFKYLVAFRHYHQHQFDCSDIYVICHLTPLTHEIQPCLSEIDDCKWIKAEELIASPEVVTMNRIALQSLLKNQEQHKSIGLTPYYSEFTQQEQKIYHIKDTDY